MSAATVVGFDATRDQRYTLAVAYPECSAWQTAIELDGLAERTRLDYLRSVSAFLVAYNVTNFNPDASLSEASHLQRVPVVTPPPRIRTGESDQRIDRPSFNPDVQPLIWTTLLLLLANVLHQAGVG